MRLGIRAILLGLCLLQLGVLSGCAMSGLPQFNKLDRLRVIAITTDQSEVAPGSSVVVTPYVSDTRGAGRALTYTAESCSDTGVAFGATPTCTGAADRVSVGTGSLSLTAPTYTQAVSSFTVTVPSTILTSRSVIDQYNGVAYLFVYTVTAADGTEVRSFRRILATTRTTRNSIPSITSFLFDDAAGTIPTTGEAQISAVLPTGAAEAYQAMAVDTTLKDLTETLTVSWFLSDGDFQRFRTVGSAANKFTAPSPRPSDRPVVVAAVVRDGRGGEAVRIESVGP